MAEITSEAEAGFAAAYVEMVRIRDFRGLNDCKVELEPGLTLLVGRNNAGKSRILRALALALGGEVAELDDLTVGSLGSATIDVIVAPPPPTSESAEEVFDTAIGQRLGTTQSLREEPLRERFGWRTTVQRSAEGLGARTEMQVLVFDHGQQEWTLSRLMRRRSRAISGTSLQCIWSILGETSSRSCPDAGRRSAVS